jgi:hypothetical protein
MGQAPKEEKELQPGKASLPHIHEASPGHQSKIKNLKSKIG